MTSASLSPAHEAWAQTFKNAQWLDVLTLREALPDLTAGTLLHAGPPLSGEIPEATKNAACQALIFEGLAHSFDEALAMLQQGSVQLKPAQDFGVVTPLAQVVSASMPVAKVGCGEHYALAPLVEGPPPALRFGNRDPHILGRLQDIKQLGLKRLAPMLRARPVALDGVIAFALQHGQECHAQTQQANQALIALLPELSPQEQQTLTNSPGFVLTILMAAAAWRMQCSDAPLSAAGGNGLVFGVKRQGQSQWQTLPAAPPTGTRFGAHTHTPALGAIGDSAVLDFCGLGGQALAASPELCREWQATLPYEAHTQRACVCHPITGLVDPKQVAQSLRPPLVHLAILSALPDSQLIGRGWYAPDAQFFQ